jgi:hypothetical protein
MVIAFTSKGVYYYVQKKGCTPQRGKSFFLRLVRYAARYLRSLKGQQNFCLRAVGYNFRTCMLRNSKILWISTMNI